MNDKIGIILRGKYRLIEEIGRSTAVVYLARDEHVNTYWAVKLLEEGKRSQAEEFKREVELLAALDHPAIPSIIDQIQVGSDMYVVMDFIAGMPLSQKLKEDGAQDEKDVREWFLQLADILDYMHTVRENPIVYMDMKPGNVRLAPNGKVRLIDFGTAKECARGKQLLGDMRGTRGFAPREQYNNGSRLIDERTDVYSLGAMMYCLLTRKIPPEAPKEIPPIRQVNPVVTEGMEQIILKCTRPDPADRYRNMQELVADLNNIDQLNLSFRKKMNRRMGSFIAAAVAAAGLFVLSAVGNYGYKEEQSQGYDAAIERAADYERIGERDLAAQEYISAIGYSDAGIPGYADEYLDSYVNLYDVLLPKSADADYDESTRNAVRQMSAAYIDQERSPMYQNPDLMLKTVQVALDSGDPALVGIAHRYLSVLAEQENNLDSGVIDSYLIMAQMMGDGAVEQDALKEAVARLEERSSPQNMSTDDILRNYTLIIKMLSAYPQNFDDPYEHIYGLGADAMRLITESGEELSFNGTIQLCKMVASAMQAAVGGAEDKAQKEEYYNRSLEWFTYLDELGGLPETDMELRKGDVYMGLYNLSNTDSAAAQPSAEDIANLDSAIEIYRQITVNEPENFQALVKLTNALLSRAIETGEGIEEVEGYYTAAETMKRNIDAQSQDVPHSVSMSFAALTQAMQDARKLYFEHAAQEEAQTEGAAEPQDLP